MQTHMGDRQTDRTTQTHRRVTDRQIELYTHRSVTYRIRKVVTDRKEEREKGRQKLKEKWADMCAVFMHSIISTDVTAPDDMSKLTAQRH